ncbi:hypothetical protein LAW94_23085, partial [Escherichia coli]|nr:hypothetical protein [Escherichia coli]
WKGWAILLRQKQKKLIMLPSETMIWQPEFTDKTLSRKPGAVQSENHSIVGKYTHWESKNDNYIRFLIRNIHLKDSSKIVFTNITFKSIELLSLLIKQKNEFEISDKCIITPTNADVKKLILQLKKLTDISHVWFYINSTYLLTQYVGRLLIKWLICHDIKVDVESLKERYFYEEILQEKSQREQKVLRTTLQPVTCKAITKKRL